MLEKDICINYLNAYTAISKDRTNNRPKKAPKNCKKSSELPP